VVEAGGRVAADGVVVRGIASVDEKALTGESPRESDEVGDRVLAATVVVEGQIVIEVERTGTDTTAAKIVQILEGAGAKPMTLQRETEKIADRLVSPPSASRARPRSSRQQIDRMTSVLITDFGTGIRIAVPTSALTAHDTRRPARRAREGSAVPRAAREGRYAIVFDKTGTLTCGEPEVFEVVAVGPWPARRTDALAAAAEARQAHPIAEAIRRHASARRSTCPTPSSGASRTQDRSRPRGTRGGAARLVGGTRLMQAHGVDIVRRRAPAERTRAPGASSIFVAVDGELEAVIGYADEPRPESREVVRALKANGRRQVILMSGDARAPVLGRRAAVGIDQAFAEMLPEDKAKRVRELQRAGQDRRDDRGRHQRRACARRGRRRHLARRRHGRRARDRRRRAARRRPPEAPHAFQVADDAMRRVRRGLGFVIAPNAVAIVLGAMGLLTPAPRPSSTTGRRSPQRSPRWRPLLQGGKALARPKV
jgi:cation transport ATPase